MHRKQFQLIIVTGLCVLLLWGCATTKEKQQESDRRLRMALAYMTSGQFNPALKELMEAEHLTPDNPRIHYAIGLIYMEKNMPAEALKSLNRALELKPDYSEAHVSVGTIYYSMGRLDEAIASFNRALSNVLYETPGLAFYNLGRTYVPEKGQSDGPAHVHGGHPARPGRLSRSPGRISHRTRLDGGEQVRQGRRSLWKSGGTVAGLHGGAPETR
jgi:Tfp pilus assembly protein PilF